MFSYTARLGAFAALAAMGLIAPAHADKNPKPAPKPGTVLTGLPNCNAAPPPCFVVNRTVRGGGAPMAADEPATMTAPTGRRAASAGAAPVAEPAGRIVYGCWRSNGTVTVTDASTGCAKDALLVKIILPD